MRSPITVLAVLALAAPTLAQRIVRAKAKIREARATYREQQGTLLPSADGSALATRTRSTSSVAGSEPSVYNQYQGGFDASWELDLFGGNRRGLEAARYGAEAAEEDLRVFKEKENIVAADDADPFATLNLSRLNDEYLTTRFQRLERESRLATMKRNRAAQGQGTTTGSLDAEVQRKVRQSLEEDYVKAQVDLRNLSERYGPEHPDYDPETGTCPTTQPDDTLGPPGPGTGGLPTEPNTETPDSAADGVEPDEVNINVYGLNGRWIDNNNSRDTCVFHTGSEVGGNYLEEYVCDHGDGTGNISVTLINFRGTLAGNVITGTTTTCKFGFDSGNGFVDAPMMLTVSEDGKTLSGSWYSEVDDEDVPFSLSRQTVGNCFGQ